MSHSSERGRIAKDVTTDNQTIWYPGFYESRTEEPWTKTVSDISLVELTELVQRRAQEDGEWSIRNGKVGGNEDKMRRWMEFVSKERNIQQCVGHILREKWENERTVDWVCRELAEASMVVVK